jgi:arylsulfatase A-like enzyme
LLEQVDKLGLRERTMIMFAGDNGSATAGSIHGSRTPAGKGRMTDWGVHVPLIVSAPMLTPGGWATLELADTTDVFPTMLELAHVSRAGYPLDGQSLAPLLRRSPNYVPRQWIYAQRNEARTVRNQRFKLNSSGELFDLVADPDEKTPVKVKHDVAAAAALAELSAVLTRLPANAPVPPFPEYSPTRRLQERTNTGEP